MVIAFTFSSLRKEGLVEDYLDAVYRVVALDFQLTVDSEVVFREVDFPVIELASALDTWIRDSVVRRDFSFEPTGYDAPAFQFRSTNSGWSIFSFQPVEKRWNVEGPQLEAAIKRYLEDTSTACRLLDVDLNVLLRRIHG